MSDKSLGIPELVSVESIKEKQEAEQKVRAFVDKVGETMDIYLEQAWFCLQGDEVRRSTYLKEFKKVSEAIHTAISAKHPVAQIAAKDAYALAMVRKAPATRGAIMAALVGPMLVDGQCLPGLVGLSFLDELSQETLEKFPEESAARIRLYGKTYRVNGTNAFQNAFKALLETKVAEAEKAATDQLMEKIRGIMGQSTPGISIQKIATGMPGKMGVSVPDETSGGTRHFGGVMLVESDGKHIKILEAVGKFAGKVNQLRELRRFLPVRTLLNERLTLTERVAEPVYKDLWLFHKLLRRVVESDLQRQERLKKSEDFKVACAQERANLAAKATVSNTNLWLIDKEIGTAVVSLPHWEVTAKLEGDRPRTDKFAYVSFLVERAEDGKIKVAEFPERLKGLFQNSKIMEFADPSDRFSGLGYPLAAMLRMAFGMAVTANRVASQKKPAAQEGIVEPQEPEGSAEAQ